MKGSDTIRLVHHLLGGPKVSTRTLKDNMVGLPKRTALKRTDRGKLVELQNVMDTEQGSSSSPVLCLSYWT